METSQCYGHFPEVPEAIRGYKYPSGWYLKKTGPGERGMITVRLVVTATLTCPTLLHSPSH